MTLSTRIRLVAAAALACVAAFGLALGFTAGFGFGLWSDGAAEAAPASYGVKPVPGQWCGLSRDGGRVRFQVTPDSRYITGIYADTSLGALVGGEGYNENPSQQIKGGKVIFRRDRTYWDCEERGRRGDPRPAPCRRPPCPPPGCRERRSNELMFRVTFTDPESARGTFTWTPQERKRASGSYTAWPADVAPCP